jgi:hypothetical protein
MMSVIVPPHGISTSCCPKPWSSAFIPHELGFALLFPYCSLLRAACLERASLSMLLRLGVVCHRYRHLPLGLYRRSSFGLMGGPGTRSCEAIHRLQRSFQPHHRDSYHAEPQLPRCCPLYRGSRSRPMAPQWHFLIAHS